MAIDDIDFNDDELCLGGTETQDRLRARQLERRRASARARLDALKAAGVHPNQPDFRAAREAYTKTKVDQLCHKYSGTTTKEPDHG